MKRIWIGLWVLIACSCTWNESIEQVQKDYEEHSCDEGRAVYNGYNVMATDGEERFFSTVDWTGGWKNEIPQWNAYDEGMRIYGWNALEAVYTDNYGVPAVEYRQTTGDDDGLSFIAGTDITQQDGLVSAMAGIGFRIRNLEQGLSLQVAGMQLAGVARKGSFLFPQGDLPARWTDLKDRDVRTVPMDTLSLAEGGEASVPQSGAIPVIPQRTTAWDTYGWTDGDYGSLVLLQCRITDRSGCVIWGEGEDGFAEAAIPVVIQAEMDGMSWVDIVLDVDVPWYGYTASGWRKVLNPINFSVDVEDWEEYGASVGND